MRTHQSDSPFIVIHRFTAEGKYSRSYRAKHGQPLRMEIDPVGSFIYLDDGKKLEMDDYEDCRWGKETSRRYLTAEEEVAWRIKEGTMISEVDIG